MFAEILPVWHWRDTYTDKSSNIILAGIIQNDVTVAGFDLECDMASMRTCAVVAKLAPDGSPQWIKAFGVGLSPGYLAVDAFTVAAGSDDTILVGGSVSGAVEFGGIPLPPADGNVDADDIFLLKLSASGDLIWVRRLSGQQTKTVQTVRMDAHGDIYAFGYFRGTLDFGFGPVDAPVQSAFVWKLDPGGESLWVRIFGEDLVARGGGVDDDGNVYLGANGALGWTGVGDVWGHAIVKLTSDGTEQWIRTQPGACGAGAIVFTVGPSGESAAAFSYGESTLDFGSGELHLTEGVKTVITKYDSSGDNLWAVSIGCGSDVGELAVAPDGSVVVAGTATWAIGLGDTIRQPTGGWDAFAMTLGP